MKISIVIPTLNEADRLPILIDTLRKRSGEQIFEIIVVDAGSTDETAAIAREMNVVLIEYEKGRSRQMNAGAKAAKAEILYFLHADSCPPHDFSERIIRSVKQGNVAGCFRMQFDSRHALLRFSGWLTRFNNRLCRGGDQSLFIRKDVFEKIGGYREDLVIFEDNEILERIRKQGSFDVIQSILTTSARRFRENGVVRLYLIFAWMHFRYRLGASHDSLLAYYKKHVR